MKRLARVLFLGVLLLVPLTFAQHSSGEEQATGHQGSGGHSNLDVWKWANFLILAGAAGWFLVKKGGPFFQTRGEQIRKEIAEAGRLRAEAEARFAEVERRLARLDADIEALRESARRDAAAEGERIRAATGAHLAKIQAQAEQEIAAAGKSARLELKRYSAQLSIGLARRKIAERMSAENQEALVKSFMHGLARVRKGGTS